jgi:large subunit ribosomal protein L28
MSRRCGLTGKGVQAGNSVSHANNKTRRRFLPNLQDSALFSEALGTTVRLRLSTHALRSIEHNGGLDAYILGKRSDTMDDEMQRLKRRIKKRTAAKAVAA